MGCALDAPSHGTLDQCPCEEGMVRYTRTLLELQNESPPPFPPFCPLSALSFSAYSLLCFMHTGKLTSVAVPPLHILVSDSANSHCVSDPLPQLFVG